ncbi:hypothetical protein [Aquimarina sp. 2304DJ70-9]|uniref:hypothetical protein n=1 Tax=Aquimarina penaris TaxID=3231044 RepID=UPI003461A416
MKTLLIIIIMTTLLFSFNSTAQTKSTPSKTEEKENKTDAFIQAVESQLDSSVIGVWDMTMDTRRGKRNGTITIFDDNGTLKGKNDSDEFVINNSNGELSWKSGIKTPMGKMKATYTASIDGKSMSGSMEITSGMAAGRKKPFTAVKK